MNKEQKAVSLKELKENFTAAKAVFLADYKGLTVEQATILRKTLRPLNVKVKVVKNNLARIAVKEAKLGDQAEKMLDTVVGPTMITFAFGDAAATAKVIQKFSEDNETFGIKESLLGNQAISQAQVGALAKLPRREVLLAQMLGSMNAPITNFVGTLAAVPRGFVQVLAAIEAKKKAQEQ